MFAPACAASLRRAPVFRVSTLRRSVATLHRTGCRSTASPSCLASCIRAPVARAGATRGFYTAHKAVAEAMRPANKGLARSTRLTGRPSVLLPSMARVGRAVRASAGRRFCSSKGSAGAGAETAAKVGPLGRMAAWYSHHLDVNPIITKVLSSTTITMIGDLSCQIFIERNPSLDFKRLSIMALLGAVLVAPCLHFWYGFMFTHIVPRFAGHKSTLVMLAMDQLLFAPPFIVAFVAAMKTLEGKPEEIGDFIRKQLFNSIQVNWIMWVPAQTINFAFVPVQFRVLFSNFTALFWNAYLSWAGHKEEEAEH